MERAITAFDALLFVLYLGLLVFYCRAFFSSQRVPGRVFLYSLPAVLCLHFIKLLVQGVSQGHCPILGIGEIFSFTAFFLGCMYLVMERRQRYYATGAIFVGIVFVFQAVAFFAPHSEGSAALLKGVPYGLHAPIALIAMAAFAASALYGIMYLIMFRFLKSKRFGANMRMMPSLDRIETMLELSSATGLAFFCVALFGGLFLGLRYREIVAYDPKILASLAVLSIFAYGAVGSRFFGFHGKRKSIVAIAGFLVAVISMTVVRYCMTTFHSF